MSLFNFQLKKFDECYVNPPEGAEKPDMCWFWFTYSTYWLDFGGQEIFRVTDEVAQKWPDDSIHLEYPLSRLLEDLCEILPSVAQPLPKNVFDFVSSLRKIENLEICAQKWFDDHEEESGPDFYESAAYRKYGKVQQFLYDRNLSLMHINHGHYLFMLRHEDGLHIFWDMSGDDDGIELWANSKGSFALSWELFVEEIRMFFDSFFVAMDRQLEEAGKHYIEKGSQADFNLYMDKNGVQGGIDSLLAEHEQRCRTFYNCFADFQEKQDIDWEDLSDCIKAIVNYRV